MIIGKGEKVNGFGESEKYKKKLKIKRKLIGNMGIERGIGEKAITKTKRRQ